MPLQYFDFSINLAYGCITQERFFQRLSGKFCRLADHCLNQPLKLLRINFNAMPLEEGLQLALGRFFVGLKFGVACLLSSFSLVVARRPRRRR
ncbi:hypothetical protein APA44_17715 [Pseudomonas aeruginosa]|nr:hypothetical protein G039_0331385 [Pseudomonas aeruginosa VRFPA01]KFF32674.1 hypothetical protein G039_0328880 [Pseudomonas aeruginosa VRFPA01]KSL11137.1 hypothetical protein APA44_17715 [Pseudomonas aeruginosa]